MASYFSSLNRLFFFHQNKEIRKEEVRSQTREHHPPRLILEPKPCKSDLAMLEDIHHYYGAAGNRGVEGERPLVGPKRIDMERIIQLKSLIFPDKHQVEVILEVFF